MLVSRQFHIYTRIGRDDEDIKGLNDSEYHTGNAGPSSRTYLALRVS